MTKIPPAETLTITTNHWTVPSEKGALAGILEGRPSEAEIRALRKQAKEKRKNWLPSQEALDLVEHLKGYIGHRICIQFWDSIMFYLEEEGPFPLEGDCIDVVTFAQDGFLQAFVVLENIRVLPNAEGHSPLGYLNADDDHPGFLAPLSVIYKLNLVAPFEEVELPKGSAV